MLSLVAMFFAVFLIPANVNAAEIRIPEVRVDATPPFANPDAYGALLLIDPVSGTTLYSHGATSTWTAASLTKLMTVKVFTTTPTNWNLNASILQKDEVGGGRLVVDAGSVMTLRDMMYSAIVGSANNCATALGRLFDRSGLSAFVARMNSFAVDHGMAQTRLNDPSGMNEKNTLSAYDVVTMMLEGSEDPEIKKAMGTPFYAFTMKKPIESKTIKNTNALIFGYEDIIVTAGKTGYLDEARYSLVVRAHIKGDASKDLIAVVLGAQERQDSFDAAAALLRWGWAHATWNTYQGSAFFGRNLEKGDRGDDVLALQKFLNANGYPVAASGAGSPGKETSLFGEMTKSALIKFQQAHAKETLGIHGAKTASGYLDAPTRAVIHEALKRNSLTP